MELSAIEHIWHGFQAFIERNGWRILALTVAGYLLKQKVSTFVTQRHIQRTLAEANDPERVAVLQREASRVRAEQQRRLQETLPRRKSKAPSVATASGQNAKKQT
ncbi:hypothetical protein ATCC90586_001753 [Pythium insidiosum]|nr:hypothetical protein ATCC90586_001753 [Pythium insidiosum]